MRSRLPWLALGALLGLAILGPMAALSGQTALDKAVTRLAGSPFTELFDIDARIDALEAGVPAAEVTYSVADANDWPGDDPILVSTALDLAADRVAALEVVAAYTVSDATDWSGGIDPGTLVQGTDQLADRVKALEGGASPTYVRRITVAVGAEVADHRTFTVTIKDSAGATVAGADTLRIGFYNDETTASLANSAVWPVADVGSGAIGTTLGGGSQLFMATTAAGVLQLDVNDIGGASGTTIWAHIELRHDGTVGLTSAPVLVAVAFDGV